MNKKNKEIDDTINKLKEPIEIPSPYSSPWIYTSYSQQERDTKKELENKIKAINIELQKRAVEIAERQDFFNKQHIRFNKKIIKLNSILILITALLGILYILKAEFSTSL